MNSKIFLRVLKRSLKSLKNLLLQLKEKSQRKEKVLLLRECLELISVVHSLLNLRKISKVLLVVDFWTLLKPLEMMMKKLRKKIPKFNKK